MQGKLVWPVLGYNKGSLNNNYRVGTPIHPARLRCAKGYIQRVCAPLRALPDGCLDAPKSAVIIERAQVSAPIEEYIVTSAAADDQLIDRFGRRIDYVRLSVTDRCDFRCVYCMEEKMQFLPRAQLLTLEENLQVLQAFVGMGVSKLRITGGEPLVRRNVLWLFERLGELPGIDDLTLTSNGSQLQKLAAPLAAAGVTRINISLDTLQPQRFHELTRTGELDKVLRGIDAALAASFQRIKLNSVLLRGRNDDEAAALVRFAMARDIDISFIEEMPLGLNSDHDRAAVFYSSDDLRADLAADFELLPSSHQSGGPSRYWQVVGSGTRVGFISPHSHNFCASCNRVRMTSEGRLLLCLGHEHSVDLRHVLRANPGDTAALRQAIRDAMALKPERHEFALDGQPVVLRHMNSTGG